MHDHEHAAPIDHALLDAVEAEIARAIERVTALDVGPDPAAGGDGLQQTFERLGANLAVWEGRLAELAGKTAGIEVELNHQEAVLKKWFEAAGATNARLSEVANG